MVTRLYVGKNRFQFIHIFLDPTKLCDRVKKTGNRLLLQNRLDVGLFVKDGLGIVRETGHVHVQQNIGTIDQRDMGFHCAKVGGRDMVKAEMLLDMFVKNLNLPPQTIAHDDLFRTDAEIRTGEILAATMPSLLEF